MASGQHNTVIKMEPRRGVIYDRYKEPLAINIDMPSVFCNPREMADSDKEHISEELSIVLGLDFNKVYSRLKKDKAFVWIKRKIEPEVAELLRDKKLKGIHFLDESKRRYTNDSLACHIVGFAGLDNNGLEGIERTHNKELKGSPGWRHLVRDAKLRTVLLNENDSIPALNGNNIVLTIDAVVQYIVEEELAKMSEEFNVSSAVCVVMDPYTGQILALANYPAYDLNDFHHVPRNVMKNISVANIYEPGSVFKIITACAALNEEVVDLNEEVYCENGECMLGGRILHDYHKYGDLTFAEVISKSSNIGTVKVAQKLGAQKLFEYIQAFGFGKKTGIDITGEVSGISRPPSIWSRSDITTIPIGQGIAVTAIQLVRAIGVVANSGYLMKPYIIDSIISPEGEVLKQFKPVNEGSIISSEVCDKMKDVLAQVISEGTGRFAKSDSYELCGKTGTAQMVNPAGGYYDNKYNATFLGFAPKNDPKICIVVTAFDPHPVHFGGVVSGPVFKRIAERTLKYLGTKQGVKENIL